MQFVLLQALHDTDRAGGLKAVGLSSMQECAAVAQLTHHDTAETL
jgi:hypothetical protein